MVDYMMIRFILPLFTGVFSLLFVISLTSGAVFNGWLAVFWTLVNIGVFGVNIPILVFDDLYRMTFGVKKDQTDASVLDLVWGGWWWGDSNGQEKLWVLYPEFQSFFWTKAAAWLAHVIVHIMYRSDASLYLMWRYECPTNDCTEFSDEIIQELEQSKRGSGVLDAASGDTTPKDRDDGLDNFDF